MMNIKVQCCGMVIIWLITIFYWRLPRMRVRTKKTFSGLLVIANFCVLTDIFSVIAIYNEKLLPPVLVRASCKIYLIFLMLMIYSGFLYICSDIYKNDEKYYKRRKWYGIFLAAAECLMLALPIGYVCEAGGNVIYSYGASTIVAYIFFVAIFVSMLIHLHTGRKGMNPRRRMAVNFWLTIWLLSALWQFLDSTLLIVSFAGCLGVTIIFSMIENPELSLDKESNFFHTSAMLQYMSELYGNNRQFELICTQFQKQHMDFYKEIDNADVFVGGGEIYMLFFDRESAKEVLDRFHATFYKQPIYVVWDYAVAESAGELLSLLKDAQRVSKWEQGGDVCVLDEKLKNELEERKRTEKLIQEAIHNDRIEVFYQPIYDIKKEKFSSAEALMRIRDEEGKIIPPNVFIPVAEDEGSIIELGRIVFDKVCHFLEKHRKDGLGLSYIEVNLSVVQGQDRFLATDVLATMEKYHVSANQINFEITESASITGREQLLRTMEAMEIHGIAFSLDDFGTGQSNLDYMATMPVQLVKFDRSMTQNYFVSEKTQNIMVAAIQMIHNMHMKIVAEGIETADQFEEMKRQGIEYIQGYFFSKPLPEEEFYRFLKERN